jgi:poly(hydroxyalkanoate) depolymerase family esterase
MYRRLLIMNGMSTVMAEATRLTRKGQLREATALIQRALRGQSVPEPSPDTPNSTVNEPIDAEFRVIESAPQVFTQRPDHSTQPTEQADSPEERDASTSISIVSREPAFLSAMLRSIPNPLEASVLKPKPDRNNRDVWAGGRFIKASFTNEAGTRTYKLYIPSGYRGQALPLVVMLHGCTQDSDDFAAGTRMNALAEQKPFFVLYPEQTASANPSRCWSWFKASDQHRGHGEPAILAGLTREIIRAYRLDEQRIYIAGLSAGGAMAMVLGVNYPDLYAAIGVHSGLPYAAAHDMPSAFAAMQQGQSNSLLSPHRKGTDSGRPIHPVPAIVFHGDRDTTVHPGNGDQVLAQWAKAHSNSMAGTKLRITEQRGQVPAGHGYTRSLYRDAHDRTVLERWWVHGAGHAWSGGSAKGSFTDPKGPEASAEMVRFFFQHPRNPA